MGLRLIPEEVTAACTGAFCGCGDCEGVGTIFGDMVGKTGGAAAVAAVLEAGFGAATTAWATATAEVAITGAATGAGTPAVRGGGCPMLAAGVAATRTGEIGVCAPVLVVGGGGGGVGSQKSV